jgi:hypothetical protein
MRRPSALNATPQTVVWLAEAEPRPFLDVPIDTSQFALMGAAGARQSDTKRSLAAIATVAAATTTSGPPLLKGRWPNRTGTRHRKWGWFKLSDSATR